MYTQVPLGSIWYCRCVPWFHLSWTSFNILVAVNAQIVSLVHRWVVQHKFYGQFHSHKTQYIGLHSGSFQTFHVYQASFTSLNCCCLCDSPCLFPKTPNLLLFHIGISLSSCLDISDQYPVVLGPSKLPKI